MKIKIDFVTNSSSCSFYIMKKDITEDQRLMIYNHIELSYVMSSDSIVWNRKHDEWEITEDHEKIEGDTSMDNFDMRWFLRNIGIEEEYIHYER